MNVVKRLSYFNKIIFNKYKLIIISYRYCFINIYIFENIMKDNGYELWDENIYYLLFGKANIINNFRYIN